MLPIKTLFSPVFIFLLMSFHNNAVDDIQNYTWDLVKIRKGGSEENVSSCKLFIAFSDSLLAMNDGCNWHGGTFRTSGDTLTIKISVSTELDCRGNEPCYLLRLSEKNTFLVRNNTLEILNFKTKQVYVFVRGQEWKHG